MNPEDAKGLMVQRIIDTIEEDVAIGSSSLNGSISRRIHEHAERLARDLAVSMARREFDFGSTISQEEQIGSVDETSPRNQLNDLTGTECCGFDRDI